MTVIFTLENFSTLNKDRCEKGFRSKVEAWSETDWGCALAGEVGELCNLLKKRLRVTSRAHGYGGNPTVEEVADEMADVFAYLDLLATRMGIDLKGAIIKKWNEVSERVEYEKVLVK